MESSQKQPVYQIIYNSIHKKINQKELKPGDRIPTEKELTEAFNTSRITASRAVRELENAGYVTRIKARGSFVNPESRWNSNSLQNNTLNKPVISVVFPSPTRKISLEMEVLHGIETGCRDQGYNFTIQCTGNDDSGGRSIQKRELINNLMNEGSAGVIIYPDTTMDSPEIYNQMTCRSFPFVLLDRKVFGIEAPIVSSENIEGFFELTSNVIAKGHSRIAFISGNTYESSCRSDRFQGYLKALSVHRLPVHDSYIIHNLFPENYNNSFYGDTDGQDENYNRAIKTMLNRLLSMPEPPTALMTSNDYIALNILSVANEMGINIPEDLSLTGFDGLAINSLFNTRLTTIAQDFSQIGRQSVALLDKLIKNPRLRKTDIKIKTRLINGDSVREIHSN